MGMQAQEEDEVTDHIQRIREARTRAETLTAKSDEAKEQVRLAILDALDAGISQSDIARAISISRQYIHQIATRRREHQLVETRTPH